jgi:hypothetical protein
MDGYKHDSRRRRQRNKKEEWIGVFSETALLRQKRVFMYDMAGQEGDNRVILTALFRSHRDIERFYKYDDVIVVGRVSNFIGRIDDYSRMRWI